MVPPLFFIKILIMEDQLLISQEELDRVKAMIGLCKTLKEEALQLALELQRFGFLQGADV